MNIIIPSINNDDQKSDKPEKIDNPKPEEFTILLKFLTDEIRTVSFPIEYFQKNIKEFKSLIFPIETSSNKTIKLIYKGRLLQDSDLLSNYSLIEKDVLHVVLNNDHEDQTQIRINQPTNIISNSNIEIEMNYLQNLYNHDFSMQIIRHEGFDKFCDEAFLLEDIEILREIHHVGYQIDRYSGSRIQMIDKEEIIMRTSILLLRAQLLKIKEERIKKDKGTYIHFIVGAILGYFFNVLTLLVLVFFKSPKMATLGTLLGFLAKIAVISFNNVNKTLI